MEPASRQRDRARGWVLAIGGGGDESIVNGIAMCRIRSAAKMTAPFSTTTSQVLPAVSSSSAERAPPFDADAAARRQSSSRSRHLASQLLNRIWKTGRCARFRACAR